MQKIAKKSKSEHKSNSSAEFDGVIDGFINSVLEDITGFLFRKIDFDAESLQTLT